VPKAAAIHNIRLEVRSKDKEESSMKLVLVIGAMFAMLFVGAGAASAQSLGPGSKCEAAKSQEAGKLSACLHKAEARKIKTKGQCSIGMTSCFRDADCPPAETCTKDLTKVNAAVAKCETKFAAKWGKLTQQAAEKLDPCPDGLAADDVQGAVGTCVAKVASGLTGAGLTATLAEVAGTYVFGPGSRLVPIDPITGALDLDEAVDLENEEMTVVVTGDGQISLQSDTIGTIQAGAVVRDETVGTQIPDQPYVGSVDSELPDLGFPPVFSGIDPLMLEKSGGLFGVAVDTSWRTEIQTFAGRKYELQVRCCPRTS